MRKISWILWLPLFLLFAQQGELRHEYSHFGEQKESSKDKAPPGSDHCPLCLAYAHLAGAAKPEIPAAALLGGLSFHFAPAFAVASADTAVAAPRSRGPPAL